MEASENEHDRMMMAASIAAVRTLRFEPREFQGVHSPRMRAEAGNFVALARLLLRIVRGQL